MKNLVFISWGSGEHSFTLVHAGTNVQFGIDNSFGEIMLLK